MKKRKSKKNRPKKTNSLESRIIQDKDWKEFDVFVNREIEDMKLQYKNAGYE